ncbi:MAG: methionyl-tRNA formyltransferase [Candidatus Paceibacterota bacterium]
MIEKPPFVFFGTDQFAVAVLDRLKKAGLKPGLIVTTPDSPQGRGQKTKPSTVASWAKENNRKFIRPAKLDEKEIRHHYPILLDVSAEIFIVASYGKIIPEYLIEHPPKKTLNIHPSLLPRLRGPAPIAGAILAAEETGITIMVLDKLMDHGPIIGQQTIDISGQSAGQAGLTLAQAGADLLVDLLPAWLAGKLKAEDQDHHLATFSKKITKTDGLIDPTGEAGGNYRRYLALSPTPGTYFFQQTNGQNTRIKITAAHLADNRFIIDRVIPAGKAEMSWIDFSRNIK